MFTKLSPYTKPVYLLCVTVTSSDKVMRSFAFVCSFVCKITGTVVDRF